MNLVPITHRRPRRIVPGVVVAAALLVGPLGPWGLPGLPAVHVEATPATSITAQPGIDRLTGGSISTDSANVGGTQINFLPTDERTAIERQIEQDVVTAINYERTSRALTPLSFSEHLTSIRHRWNEMVASDPAVTGGACPPTTDGTSCHAEAPYFAVNSLVNESKGIATRLRKVSSGAFEGTTSMSAGKFVTVLLGQGAAGRKVVLTNRADIVAVGVKCLPDGRTYMEFEGWVGNNSLDKVTPAAYDGADLDSNGSPEFGTRCPQPGPTHTATSPSANTISTIVVGDTSGLRTTCASSPSGPAAANDDYAFTYRVYDASGAIVGERTQNSATDDPVAQTFTGIAAGTYRVESSITSTCDTTIPASVDVTVGNPASPGSTTPPTPSTSVPTPSTSVPTSPGSPTSPSSPGTPGSPSAPGSSPAPAAAGSTVAGAASFVPLATPTRFVDTRAETAGMRQALDACSSRIPITGRFGIPANASAVSVTLTIPGNHAGGWAALYPAGTTYSGVSSINFVAGAIRANTLVVPLGTGGAIDQLFMAPACGGDIVVDVNGYYVPVTGPVADGRYVPITPGRAYDQRLTDHPVSSGSATDTFTRRDLGIPADASAVVVNITVTDTGGGGFVTGYATATARPTASMLNWDGPGQIRAASATLPVSAGGISIYRSSGSALIVDVVGYYTGAGSPTGSSGLFVAATPKRLLDTTLTNVATATVPGTPRGVTAVAVNVTIVASGAGFLAARSTNAPAGTSSVNASYAGEVAANFGHVAAADGVIVASGGAGDFRAVIDYTGYFT